MYSLYRKRLFMVIFLYKLYVFRIHIKTMFYSKPCYNELCYKEACVWWFKYRKSKKLLFRPLQYQYYASIKNFIQVPNCLYFILFIIIIVCFLFFFLDFLHLVSLMRKITFATVQKWSLRPHLDSCKGSLFVGNLMCVPSSILSQCTSVMTNNDIQHSSGKKHVYKKIICAIKLPCRDMLSINAIHPWQKSAWSSKLVGEKH